jgi:hypothetical protein
VKHTTVNSRREGNTHTLKYLIEDETVAGVKVTSIQVPAAM